MNKYPVDEMIILQSNHLDQYLYQNHIQNLQQSSKPNIPYGTTGFRDQASQLYFISYRVGVFMGHYSKLNPTQVLGIQISASHNIVTDNGLKLTGWDGGMMDSSLESLIEQFCNGQDLEQQLLLLNDKFPTLYESQSKGLILIGQDTRPSCPIIKFLVIKGIELTQSSNYQLGEVTTPQLQFSVWAHNLNIHKDYHNITQFYMLHYTNLFKKVFQPHSQPIILDCADGVGGQWMSKIINLISDTVNVELINTGVDPQTMNQQCGSDYVQINRKYPKNFPESAKGTNTLCLSFDGDADRIIFYLPYNQDRIQLIDGDHFSYLFALTIQKMIKRIEQSLGHQIKWTIGIIQTAYANGASTLSMQSDLNIVPKTEPTGVKYLHHAAKEYDIGIYFEANGHGTLLVSDKLLSEANELLPLCPEEIQVLLDFVGLSSQATGDSICNFMLALSALRYMEITPEQWLNYFHDYPSQMKKCRVNRKQNLKTNYQENKVVEPLGLQAKIDEIVGQQSVGFRCFIRASGTEDIIRIYCEGPDTEIIRRVMDLVEELILSTEALN